jgi:hypothetical protein
MIDILLHAQALLQLIDLVLIRRDVQRGLLLANATILLKRLLLLGRQFGLKIAISQ